VVKDRLKVQLVRVNDTITIDAVCDSDTIIRTIEVPYEKITYVEKEKPMQIVQRWLLYLLSAIVGFKVIQRLLDRYFL
jgi:hypothetical protein